LNCFYCKRSGRAEADDGDDMDEDVIAGIDANKALKNVSFMVVQDKVQVKFQQTFLPSLHLLLL